MSKTVSVSLAAHLDGEALTLASLLRIVCTDSPPSVFGFTNHDAPLTFDGLTYEPASNFDPTAVATTSGMNVDNLDMVALIDSGQLSDEDFRAGLFDFAEVTLRIVNWADLSMGAVVMRTGNLGEISLKKSADVWQGEIRGLMQRLQQNIGRTYKFRCDADLGDSRCTVNLVPLTQMGTVTAASTRGWFNASGLSGVTGWFDGGLVRWQSGLNAGLGMEVKRWTTGSPDGRVDLNLPMPRNIAVGDTFTVYPGCDKNLSTCRDKFNNVVNFRGFPTIPGRDRTLAYPDAPT